MGLALVVLHGKDITKVGVGSVPLRHGEELVRDFAPSRIYYANDHTPPTGGIFTLYGAVDRLHVARAGWFERKVYNPIREQCGSYGNLAFRMMFNELVRNGSYTWSGVMLETLDQEWVEANSPPRILR